MRPGPADVEEVAAFAREAHRGQVDKQGRDYFEHHVTAVAEALLPFGDAAVMAGLLHDVVEDTPRGLAGLADRLPPEVVRAVDAVTRRPGEPYPDLIARSAADPLGRLVKLADTWVNLSGLDDLACTDPATAARLRAKYTSARATLTAALAL